MKKTRNYRFFPLLFICMGVFLFSCDAINNDEGSEDENENEEENLVNQEDPRVTNRFPAINQNNVAFDATVWIELANSTDITGNVQAEIFEFNYEDSVLFEQSGIQPSQSTGNILYTTASREGDKISFPITSRSDEMFKPASILEGYQYLVHIYSDEDDFKIYWTFNTASSSSQFSFADTLIAEEIDANNKTVYVKLVEGKIAEDDNATRFGEITDPALFWTKTTFQDDSVSIFLNGEREWANFSINNIDQGDYAIWAFVDMNGNASGDKNALPDQGDFFKGVEEFGFYSQEKVEEWKNLLQERGWQVYE